LPHSDLEQIALTADCQWFSHTN